MTFVFGPTVIALSIYTLILAHIPIQIIWTKFIVDFYTGILY